jgi:hypothetical protein
MHALLDLRQIDETQLHHEKIDANAKPLVASMAARRCPANFAKMSYVVASVVSVPRWISRLSTTVQTVHQH